MIELKNTNNEIKLERRQVNLDIVQVGKRGAGVKEGGTTGQILAKNSDTDYDTTWVNKEHASTHAEGGSDSLIGQTLNFAKWSAGEDGTPVTDIGDMAFNPTDQTMDIKMSNDVTLQVGQELVTRSKNVHNSTILNGTVVMHFGAVGNSGLTTVKPYDGTNDAIGIATEDIAVNGWGFITQIGVVRGIDTRAFQEQDLLYANLDGTLTTTETDWIVGRVISVNINGAVWVKVSHNSADYDHTHQPMIYYGVMPEASTVPEGSLFVS